MIRSLISVLSILLAASTVGAGDVAKAQPKKGRTFTLPLSARVPDALRVLPEFGTITWETTQLPWVGAGPYEGVSGAGMVEIAGKIYVVGGFIPGGDGSGDTISHRTSRWTWCYDPAATQWTQLADAPVRREYTRAIAAKGRLWLAGGGCQYKGATPPYRAHADCAAFDPAGGPTGAWTAITPLGEARTHMAVGCASGHLIVAGGNAYDFAEQGYSHKTIRGTVETLDLDHPDTGWKTRTPIPGAPRGWCASVAAADALYLFGGITWDLANATVPTPETLRYTVAADTWTALTPPPLAISGWEGALYNDRFALLVGGVVRPAPNSGGEVIWSDLAIAYDIEKDRWLRVNGALPPGAVFNDPGVVVLNDKIYVLGAEGPDGSHFNYFLIGTVQPG